MRTAAPAAGRAPRARRARRGEAGYNLVVLVIAILLLNVAVAAMLPLWSTQIRREKEEELIFRGLQYAEAIRLFQTRFQRFPTTLGELVSVQPRCIRQLWKDPMTDDGKWAPIYQGQGTPLIPSFAPPSGRASTRFGAGPVPSETNGPDASAGGANPAGNPGAPGSPGAPSFGQPPDTVEAGPIVGVHSRSTRQSIEVWNGQQQYDQWLFTYNLLSIRGPAGGPGGAPIGPGTRPPLNARWIGRPFPGLPQVAGFQPGSQPVGTAGPVVGAPGVGAPGGFGVRPVPGGVPVGGTPAPPPRPIP